mgnify:CR=1 FL=1
MTEEEKKYLASGGVLTNGKIPTLQAITGKETAPITSEALNPVMPIKIETPIPPPISAIPTPTTTPNLTPTPQEKSINDLIKEVTGISVGLAGDVASYKQEKQKELGYENLKLAEKEYSQQLAQLQTEYKNVEGKLQIESEGRGITKGGLAPITMGEQRKISVRANTVSAFLAAAQGNIDYADKQIERAIADKYGVQEAEQKAKISNLELLLKDPTLTIEQTNRANKQLAEQKKIDAEIAKKKEDDKTIFDTAKNASAKGAKPSDVSYIANSKTPIEALQKAAEKGYTIDTPASAQEFNFAVENGYKGTFTDYQNEDANRKAIINRASINGLPYQVTTQIDKLSSSFDSTPIVKQYNETQNKYFTIQQIVDNGLAGGAEDLALVFEFMKSLDPTSVVRESEYDTASKAGNPFKRVAAKMGGYFDKGAILPQEVREDFKRLSKVKLDVVTAQYDNLRAETARQINKKTGMTDGIDYLKDYSMGALEYKGINLPNDSGTNTYNGINLPN